MRWPQAGAALPPDGAYAKSKRANVVYTLELARRTGGTPVEAIVIHPGAAMTGLQQHSTSGLARAAHEPARLPRGADDPAEGARLWQESERLTGVTFTV